VLIRGGGGGGKTGSELETKIILHRESRGCRWVQQVMMDVTQTERKTVGKLEKEVWEDKDSRKSFIS
jgi:hypothetical protein